MKQKRRKQGEGWDDGECARLIDELRSLRESMLATEASLSAWIDQVNPEFLPSARNLAHYLALRQRDCRPLQEKLAWIGVSSLGRAESHVLANLDKVLGILHRILALQWSPCSAQEPAGILRSSKLLEAHTASLLGAPPPGRMVRIMVTLPVEAAGDYGMVRQFVDAGMDIARINCAHGGADEWRAMARHVRRSAKAAGRPVRILMDLAGPKLRTGRVPPGVPILKLRPHRDELGRVVTPARLRLRPAGQPAQAGDALASIGVDAGWLARIAQDDALRLTDARGARRELRVVHCDAEGVLAESGQTSYLTPETEIVHRRKGRRNRSTRIVELPAPPGVLRLERGNRLLLTRAEVGGAGAFPLPAVTCTLPEVFRQVCIGERIWFDDGRIGGIIRRVEHDALEIEITRARDGGEKLASDKGINFPDSPLELPALTDKDIGDLAVVVQLADMVGLSFAQSASDVDALRLRLEAMAADHLGIVLKIETRRGFEKLPELILAAMAGRAAGIMIARGDLAVECGYERLAEVQEEILWAAEAAHLPVIWATQVLETLARTGLPSRAEITDAAMGERAECVMLNKGPHIVDAIRTLDDILQRMQAHQSKKRALLRALNSWNVDAAAPAPAGQPRRGSGSLAP
ncbi:MAG: pyruvate kinase [Sulfuritalea sp.]|nr:pyruvate kinase [Sulfuritalea sp.]